MSDLQEVTVSAFVPPGTPVVLIEAPILRRLQAENKVLRSITDELDLAYYNAYGLSGGEGWEKYFNFEDRVQAILRDRPAPKDRE